MCQPLSKREAVGGWEEGVQKEDSSSRGHHQEEMSSEMQLRSRLCSAQ